MRRTTKDGADFLCTICGKSYLSIYTLKRHTLINHSETNKSYVCDSCSKTFSTKPNLIRHISLVHQKCGKTTENPRLKNIQCALCAGFHGTKLDLLHHYHSDHEIDTSEERLEFSNFGEFEAWKEMVEEDSISKYIRYNIKRRRDKNIYYYSCHRNGFFKTKGKNIRHMKRIGTNKINGYCPSRMYATKFLSGDTVVVEFIKTHVGHDMDMRRIPRKKVEPPSPPPKKRNSVIAVNNTPKADPTPKINIEYLQLPPAEIQPPKLLPADIPPSEALSDDVPPPKLLPAVGDLPSYKIVPEDVPTSKMVPGNVPPSEALPDLPPVLQPVMDDSHDIYEDTMVGYGEAHMDVKSGTLVNLVDVNQAPVQLKEGAIVNLVNFEGGTQNMKSGTVLNVVNLAELPKEIKDGTILNLVSVNDPSNRTENALVNLVTLSASSPMLEINRYKAILQDKFHMLLGMASSINDCRIIENALLPIEPTLMTMRATHSSPAHFSSDIVNMKFIIEP